MSAEEVCMVMDYVLEDNADLKQSLKEINDEIDCGLVDNPDLKDILQKSLKEIQNGVDCALELYTKETFNLAQAFDSCCEFEKGLMDPKIFNELQEAERQAQQTATIITELKLCVAQLLEKPHMTDLENIELEQKNKQLASYLKDFEIRTRQVQMIVNQIDTCAAIPKREQKSKDDEILPKVIICGTTENNVPKIIICDSDKKKKVKSPAQGSQSPPTLTPPIVLPQFARRLNESYNLQERLAEENANLEGTRYQLQEEIINKDQTVESLRQKVNCLQSELRVVVKENTILTGKLNEISDPGCYKCGSRPDSSKRKDTSYTYSKMENINQNTSHCPGKGICPADVESRLQNYSNITNVLERQLSQMEMQVKCMQKELESVQRERMVLQQQKQALLGSKSTNPCTAYHLEAGGGHCAENDDKKSGYTCPCNNHPGASLSSPIMEQEIRELREQLCRLQEDYKDKLTEVAQLRADAEILKQNVRDCEFAKEQAIQLMKDKEREIKCLQMEINKTLGHKEQRAEQEQQLILAKQKLHEAQDELDELRSIVGDQTAQLEEYRNKYMQAQQTVEEQRRQIDMMELENQRISDQVNLEIQRVKNKFQEKFQELIPLPEILKTTQLKLQESQQLQLCAERKAEKLELELQRSKDKEMAILVELEKLKEEGASDSVNTQNLRKQLQIYEKKIAELETEMNNDKKEICRLDDMCLINEKQLEEKKHEICMLNNQLTQLREESARQVARVKERTDTVRRTLQSQIADLERQLAQSRATCRSAQKERDEIRQKMQCQINNLNESFEQAQSRIRSLQGHVNFLKTSYSTMFPETGDGNQGDICMCNNSATL